jgi:hypothetical protein
VRIASVTTRLGLAIPLLLLAAACGERRDLAEMAAGMAPFTELRGMNIAALRVGEVRAFRRGASPAPLEGMRERIGEYDVLYGVTQYEGLDGAWPPEDHQILTVEAAREFESDAAAQSAWDSSILQIRNVTGATPHCLRVAGPGFSLRVVEFDRGGGWRLSTTVAPAVRLTNRRTLSARQGVAVRHQSITERFPAEGAENPEALPTWERIDCPGTSP